jgi:hypothetical protein
VVEKKDGPEVLVEVLEVVLAPWGSSRSPVQASFLQHFGAPRTRKHSVPELQYPPDRQHSSVALMHPSWQHCWVEAQKNPPTQHLSVREFTHVPSEQQNPEVQVAGQPCRFTGEETSNRFLGLTAKSGMMTAADSPSRMLRPGRNGTLRSVWASDRTSPMACASSTNSEYRVYIARDQSVAQPVGQKPNEENQKAGYYY